MSNKDIKKKMIEATISVVALNGIDNFTTSKLSKQANISEGSIYNHFDNKDALIDEAFNYVDSRFAEYFEYNDLFAETNISNIEDNFKNIWMDFFDFIIEHPDFTLFYNNYRYSGRYILSFDHATRYAGYRRVIEFFTNNSRHFQYKIDWNILWIYLLDMTLCFGVRAIQNSYELNTSNKQIIYQLLTNGFQGLLTV